MKRIFLLLSLFICTKVVASHDFKEFIGNFKTGNVLENLQKAQEYDKNLSEYNKIPLKLELKKIILVELQNFKVDKGLESVFLGANVVFHETTKRELEKFYSINDQKEQVFNDKYSIHADRNEIYLLTKDLSTKYKLESFHSTHYGSNNRAILSPNGKHVFISQSFPAEIDDADGDIKECKEKFKSRFYEFDLKNSININTFSLSAYSIISIIDITNPQSPRKTEEFSCNCSIRNLAVDNNLNLYLKIETNLIAYDIIKIPLGVANILMDLTITQLAFLIELNNNLNLIDQPIFKSIFDTFNPRFKEYLRQYFGEKLVNLRLSNVIIKSNDITQIVNDYLGE